MGRRGRGRGRGRAAAPEAKQEARQEAPGQGEAVDPARLTVVQLRKELKSRGIKASGRLKADLVRALREAFEEEEE